MQPVKVLLVSNHQVTTLGLGAVFRTDQRVAYQGGTRADDIAAVIVKCQDADVAVLDYPAADTERVTTLAGRLRREAPKCELVFHTESEDAEVITAAEVIGVRGLVTKSEELREVLRAVLTVSRRKDYVSPNLLTVAPAAHRGKLSRRQEQILQMLADGLDTEAIAATLLVSPETVKTHLKTISVKLGAKGRTDAVARGIRLGLIH